MLLYRNSCVADLTVHVLPGRVIEVAEEVHDACIVDVAADDNKLLLVVHLTRQCMLLVARAYLPCTLRYTLYFILWFYIVLFFLLE